MEDRRNETMFTAQINEERKTAAKAYFEKIDNGITDDSYFDLFTDDVELYFPKFGFAKGKDGIRKFGLQFGSIVNRIQHDIDNFNYVVSGNLVVVEGQESGETKQGVQWPDHNISYGKFCNVFEFEGELIKRVHIYADPDIASEDKDRIAIFHSEFEIAKMNTNEKTRAVVEAFYDIQFGRKEGNIVDLFAEEVDWDLPGNKEKFPWTGKRQTKKEVEQFFQELSQNVKSEKFDIQFISVNGENATAVGELSSKILKYNKIFNTEFVVIFKVTNGKIVKYHFLEDSYQLNEEMK